VTAGIAAVGADLIGRDTQLPDGLALRLRFLDIKATSGCAKTVVAV
jgi:hypothetical protein